MFRKQITGVAIDASGALAVQGERDGRLWSIKRLGRGESRGGTSTDAALVHLGASEFKAAVRGALKEASVTKGDVSLSLPDIMAKTVILDFEELPSGADDAMSVVAWKVAKSMYLAPEDVSVGYQLLAAGRGEEYASSPSP